MEEVCVYVCVFPLCMGLFVIHAGTYVFACCMCITVHIGISVLCFFVVYMWIMYMRLCVWYMCM